MIYNEGCSRHVKLGKNTPNIILKIMCWKITLMILIKSVFFYGRNGNRKRFSNTTQVEKCTQIRALTDDLE